MSRDEAINSAIDECIENGILKEFLLEHGSEVHNMLFAEFNMEKELKVAEEIGIEKGREEERHSLAKEMLRKGAEIDFIIGVTKLPKRKIIEFQKEIDEEKH